jgi:hypothetical protein
MTTTGHSGNSARFGTLLLPVAVSRGGGFRCSDRDRGEGGTLRLAVLNRARDKDILGNRHGRSRGRRNGVKRDGDGTNSTTMRLPSTLRSDRNYPRLTPRKTKLSGGGCGTTLTIIIQTLTEKASVTSGRHTRCQNKHNKICKSLHIDNCKQRLVRTL